MAAALALLLAMQAMQPVAPTTVFVRETLRICVDTAADPIAVRQLAKSEKWAAIDPAAVKSHTYASSGSGEAQKTTAWKVEKDGLAFTVRLTESPGGLLFSSQCELGAWDLDPNVAHKAFTADPRFKDSSRPGWPIKQYEMEKPRLSIMYMAGQLDGRVLHTFAAERR